MRKRNASAFLFLILFVFSCSFFLLLSSPPLLAQSPPVTLSIWEFPRIQNPDDPFDRFSWLRGLCDQFEREHPGVVVRVTELTWQQGEDKLKIAVFAGAPPDLTSGTLPLHFVRQGVVVPVDDALTAEDRQDYFPGALQAFTWQGRLYGFPWCSKSDVLVLNLDLFRERSVEPPAGGRWSMDQFLGAARALTFDRDGDGRPDVFGLNFCLEPGRTCEFGLMLQPGGTLLSQDGRALALAETPAGREGVALLRRLAAEGGVAPPSSGGAGQKDVWLALAERRTAAMIPCGIWAVEALRKKNPFAFGLAHFPDGPDGRPRNIISTAGYYVFKSGDPRRERAAVALARFLTLGANQRVLKPYKQFPTRRSAGDLFADDPVMQRAAGIAQFGEPLPASPSWQRVDELLQRTAQLAVLGEILPGAACDRMAAEARRILSEPASVATSESDAGGQAAGVLFGLLALLFLFVGALFSGWLLSPRDGAPAERPGASSSAWTFLAPSLLVLAVFFAYPTARAVLLAFQRYQVGQGPFDHWIWFQNFARLWDDPVFWTALVNTFVYTALTVPGNLLTGLVLASLIAPLATRWRHLFRAAFYLPGATSVVVMAMVWRWLYDVELGFINRALLSGGGSGVSGWCYQIVRNLAELPPHLPRLLLWCLGVGALAVLVRLERPARWLRRLDSGLGRALGSGPGPVGRLWRAVDRAGGDLGVAGFLLVSAAAVALAAAVLAAVPFQVFGAEKLGWLTTTKLSLASIVLSMLVRGPGGALIIYLAAIEQCPKDLHESAEIDGAGALARWWHITLPLLRPTTLFLLVTQTIGSFQVFAQVSLLTDGGPGTSSTVLVHRVYTAAFRDLDFGYASAMALVLFLVIAAISAVQFALLGDER